MRVRQLFHVGVHVMQKSILLCLVFRRRTADLLPLRSSIWACSLSLSLSLHLSHCLSPSLSLSLTHRCGPSPWMGSHLKENICLRQLCNREAGADFCFFCFVFFCWLKAPLCSFSALKPNQNHFQRFADCKGGGWHPCHKRVPGKEPKWLRPIPGQLLCEWQGSHSLHYKLMTHKNDFETTILRQKVYTVVL